MEKGLRFAIREADGPSAPAPSRKSWSKRPRCANHHPGLHGLQTAELFEYEEQVEADGPPGDQQVLSVLPETHSHKETK